MEEPNTPPGGMIAPKFHHFAPGQWINDPVGLHRMDGLWVLHDQRARSAGDEAIGWGRSTSPDLVAWRDEGVAIAAEPDGWIYSGSVVSNGAQLHAFFTLHHPSSGLQSQAEACWEGGWERLPGERVAGQPETRDPFVFRCGDEWRMLLAQPPSWAAPIERRARLMLLGSADLETWHELGPLGPLSELGEMFETPLLRPVPVAGERSDRWPWLLAVGVVDRRLGAVCGTRAWFGGFDGKAFEPVGAPFSLDSGPDFYAPAAWAGTADAEFVLTAWTNSWAYARRLPSAGWSGGAHALPRRLWAVRDGQAWALRQRPAALPSMGAARGLAEGTHAIAPHCLLSFDGSGTARLGDLGLVIDADTLTIERVCAVPALSESGFEGRWTAPRPAGPLNWLLDGCVAELFSADGTLWMSALTLRSKDMMLELSDGLAATIRPMG